MALVQCPECGRQVSEVALACPACGFPFSGVQARQPAGKAIRGGIRWLRLLLIAASGTVVAFALGHVVDGWIIAGNEATRTVYEVCKADPWCDTGFLPLSSGGRTLLAVGMIASLATAARMSRVRS
jgi:hypothetical protein